jgi:2',3'-cyclic-nucleotide 2'-phosphodiesterase (5'-nucleotidase family)
MIGPKDFAMGLAPLKAWLDNVGAPVVAGNLTDESGKQLFQDSVVITRDGRKFGFFGLFTQDMKDYGRAIDAPGVKIGDPIEHAKKVFAELKAKSDIVIALTSLNDDEVEKLAAAVPDLQLVLRSNARGQDTRRNQNFESGAISMGLPNRGKYIGLLTLNEIDGDLTFEDRSQRTNLVNRIKSFETRLQSMAEAHETKNVAELKKAVADNESKMRRITNYELKVERFKAELKEITAEGSYLEMDRVSLDTRVKNDIAVKQIVDEVIGKWGEPGRINKKPKKVLH